MQIVLGIVAFAGIIGQLIAIKPRNSLCTASCDAENGGGNAITFCGTDLNTYSTTFDALDDCYREQCAIMTYYPGVCGCPNNCFEDYSQGKCSASSIGNSCVCSAGWTGSDCSLVATSNICSLRGKLINPSDKDASFPFAYCLCDEGWTGSDCSSPVFSAGFLPFGNIFSGNAFTSEDPYGDTHPVWNTTLLATIRINLDEAVFLDLLQPWNAFNESYAHATVHFDNGYIQQTIQDVGFRQKGSGCRDHQKHCWNIKFNEFVSGQKFFGMKKLGIKGGTDDDDVMAKYMMFVDMLRATVSPTQRTSYLLLYINDIFMGLNFMHEDIDPDYMLSRLAGDTGEGNLMKFDGGIYLQYQGDDVNTYKNNTNIDQVEGNGDWSDFVSFLKFLNTSTDAEFDQQLDVLGECRSRVESDDSRIVFNGY